MSRGSDSDLQIAGSTDHPIVPLVYPSAVSTESPIRYGFRTVARAPDLAVAEIAWRWAWGAASLAIAWFAAHEFLRSLLVSGWDRFRLESGNPQLIAAAIVAIFGDSGPTLLRLSLIITPSVLVLWTAAATLGRAATLRALIADRSIVARTFFLHAWRVVVGIAFFIATVAVFFMAAVVAGRGAQPQPFLFIVIFFPLAIVLNVVRSRIGWLLLLANLYVAHGKGASEGFGLASRLAKRRGKDFAAVGFVAGMIRIALMAVVTVASLFVLAGIGRVPAWLLWLAFILATLAYFAVSDYLYMVKLAAYAAIVGEDLEPVLADPPMREPLPPAHLPIQV